MCPRSKLAAYADYHALSDSVKFSFPRYLTLQNHPSSVNSFQYVLYPVH